MAPQSRAYMYTNTRTDTQNDQSHNLLQCSLCSHLAEIMNEQRLTSAYTRYTSLVLVCVVIENVKRCRRCVEERRRLELNHLM